MIEDKDILTLEDLDSFIEAVKERAIKTVPTIFMEGKECYVLVDPATFKQLQEAVRNTPE